MARPVRLLLLFLAACQGKTDPAAAIAPPPVPVAAPKPQPPPDLSLGAGFEMRRPVHDGRMTVIPIVATGDVPQIHYATLTEGIAHHKVSVREVPSWAVDQ